VPEPTNRRGFLRAFVRSAGEAFVEATDAVKGELDEPEAAPSSGSATDAAPPPPSAGPLTQAEPVAHTLTVDEVLDLAAEEGLAHRADAVRDLVRASTRLTPVAGDGPARSRIGRPAATADAEGPVATVADIDLADPALAAGPLPGSGRLVAQVVVPRRPPIPSFSRADVRVEPDDGTPRDEALGVELSTELSLPRVWAAPVSALMFVEAEQNAYIRLRERVAELQGVQVEDGDAEGIARHHLLGYPTETTGTMPLECELAARNRDRDTPPHRLPPEVVAASTRWRLLLQLTQDVDRGVVLGAGPERLYLWIARDALEREDFSQVWAIAR
jgi:uncharacterized protein DUF1963